VKQPSRHIHTTNISCSAHPIKNAPSDPILSVKGRQIHAHCLSKFVPFDPDRRAHVRHAIIDKDVKIPSGFEIGWNHDIYRNRGMTITPDVLTVIAKGEDLERFV
jgi:hypothetical protein